MKYYYNSKFWNVKKDFKLALHLIGFGILFATIFKFPK